MKRFHAFLLCCSFLSFQIPSFAQVVVNEYSCANWHQFYDSYFKDEDWIELYNTASTPAGIGGYFLSDNPDKPEKWEIPAGTTIGAHGFLRVWCSGRDELAGGQLHTNFRLTQTKSNPESIVLSDNTGLVLETIEVRKTLVAQSVARTTDGAGTWSICTAPTPAWSNNAAPMFAGFADRPSMSQSAGFYAGSVELTITTDEPNSEIRYTIDGTEPGTNSLLYTGQITLTETTVLKARTFSNDPAILPGFVQFNTYFVNVSHTLPVISVAGEDLLELANGNSTLRPVGCIEYFGKDLQRKTRAYGELNSHGQDSWANDQRSLDWVTRDEMGYNNALEEKLFNLTERDEFQRIILRATGDDNYPAANHPQNAGSAHVRDDYVHTLAQKAGLSVDVRTSERAIVFLNGQYWGVYSIREIPDDHDYTEYYYGQDKYNIQYVLTWGSTWAEYGGQQALDDWWDLRSYILNSNVIDPVVYQNIMEQYDGLSLIDYVLINGATVCSDWLNWNTGLWRGLNPEGDHQRWGYILWDNDATFGHYINYTGIPNTTPFAPPCDPEGLSGGSDPQLHIAVLNKLRENAEFNQLYLTRQNDLRNTVFSCENMLSLLDSMIAVIDPEMAQHADRWFGTYAGWKTNVQKLRTFVEDRCAFLPDGIGDCYNLNGPYDVVVLVDPPGASTMKINTLQADQFPWHSSYFGNIESKFTLQPASGTGLVFDRWESLGGQTIFPDVNAPDILVDFNGPDTLIARFKNLVSATAPVSNGFEFEVAPTIATRETTLRFELPKSMPLTVRLYSSLGHLVATYDQGTLAAGGHTLRLDLSGIRPAPGVYLIEVDAAGHRAGKRIAVAANN